MQRHIKILVLIGSAILLGQVGCENPARIPYEPQETPAERTQRELIEGKPSFQTRYHPRDTMFGHPRGYCYLPGEQAIPYDTLKNTHQFYAALYCDTVGWGVYYMPIERDPYIHGVVSSSIHEGYSFYYGVNGEAIFGQRFSRNSVGVLEIEEPQGMCVPNHTVVRGSPPSDWRPYTGEFFQVATNWHNVWGWEVTYKGQTINVPGALITRADYFENQFMPRNNPFGTWRSISVNNLGRAYPFLPDELRPEHFVEMPYYVPPRLYMRPLDKAIGERYHRRGEPLRLTWQGDIDRPHDSIIISISTYNNTFPKEFGFDYGDIKSIMGRGTYENGRQIDITNVDVNKPRGPNQGHGPRPFDLVPSLEGREDDHRRIFMQYRDATPLPHIEWNQTVFESDGTNVVEIPASVFEQFPSNRLIEVRAYRWFDNKAYVPDQLWLAGENKTHRSHVRIVTFSYGGFYLED